MIIEICFQWETITEGLREHYEIVKKTCEEEDGVEFMGLFGPLNERWNWVYMFKAESFDRLREVSGKWDERYGGRPKQATNVIWKILIPYEP